MARNTTEKLMQCFQVILQILRKEIKKKTKITLLAGSVSTRDVTKTKALFNIYHYAVLASVVQRMEGTMIF